MLKLAFLTTLLSAMLKLTLLTTPLSNHAETGIFDHTPYSPPYPVATGLQTIKFLFLQDNVFSYNIRIIKHYSD
jgi:hypothetical protein